MCSAGLWQLDNKLSWDISHTITPETSQLYAQSIHRCDGISNVLNRRYRTKIKSFLNEIVTIHTAT